MSLFIELYSFKYKSKNLSQIKVNDLNFFFQSEQHEFFDVLGSKCGGRMFLLQQSLGRLEWRPSPSFQSHDYILKPKK
ncbi:hypothetical protein BpHYR1_033704 [Brachionus plicatilis]|uniref:Uncharacterized protein n=1 Tax=Brachionus plicatilis TaxID=10195 RepID=A0A3M7SKI5_BRAPC|nr:hypothetical protein BpHYR1_033704 [Brachionus plicatilis]